MRAFHWRAVVWLMVLVAWCGPASRSLGQGSNVMLRDTVVVTGGRSYTGTIIENTPTHILIDFEANGIKSRVRLDRRDVVSVTLAEAIPMPAAPSSDEPEIVKAQGPLVFEIPLVGTFGEDIFPIGFRKSMEIAVAMGASDVVLRIDSPGGLVWAAQAIAGIMDEHRDKVRFHALVERGISASIWPVFNCESIWMAPGAQLGAAVVFRAGESGNAEVDAKFNAATASELAADAEVRGHSVHVIRAMILQASELHAVASQDGATVKLFARAPQAADGQVVEVIDDKESVLSLTAAEADRLGVAVALESDRLSEVIEAAGIESPAVEQERAAALMAEWAEKCGDVVNDIERSVRDIQRGLGEYEAAQELPDAIRALEDVRDGYAKYNRATVAAERYELGKALERDTVKEVLGQVQEALGELRRIQREQRRKP